MPGHVVEGRCPTLLRYSGVMRLRRGARLWDEQAEIARLQPGKLYQREPMLSLPPNTYERPAPLREVDPSLGPPNYVGMGIGECHNSL